MFSTRANEFGRTKSRISFWTHSILTRAARACTRALSRRYFVLSTPVTEKPLFARAMLHLPGPQQRSSTDLPAGLVSASAFAICSCASAIRFSGNMNGYSSRQNESSSNHSFFRAVFFIGSAEYPTKPLAARSSLELRNCVNSGNLPCRKTTFAPGLRQRCSRDRVRHLTVRFRVAQNWEFRIRD